jgi:hypothetical protein
VKQYLKEEKIMTSGEILQNHVAVSKYSVDVKMSFLTQIYLKREVPSIYYRKKEYCNIQLGARVCMKLVIIRVRVVNFATSKTLTVNSTMFPHCNIHKFTSTSPDGKTHSQIYHILIDGRQHSSVLDVKLFWGAECDTDHYLVVVRVKD